MDRETLIKSIAGIAGLLVITLISVVAGAVSVMIVPSVIAVVLYLLSFISLGFAQAIVLIFAGIGAVLGFLRVGFLLFIAGESVNTVSNSN